MQRACNMPRFLSPRTCRVRQDAGPSTSRRLKDQQEAERQPKVDRCSHFPDSVCAFRKLDLRLLNTLNPTAGCSRIRPSSFRLRVSHWLIDRATPHSITVRPTLNLLHQYPPKLVCDPKGNEWTADSGTVCLNGFFNLKI